MTPHAAVDAARRLAALAAVALTLAYGGRALARTLREGPLPPMGGPAGEADAERWRAQRAAAGLR
ncbi:MAG: hypothetical protein HY722_11040 [Planctomycetes bacterium]|nr:hypothetical protein [Planctomycetota bacterium]